MTAAPERIQLRRTKGWRKPVGMVSCARPGRFGNPFRVRGRWVIEPSGFERWCAPGEANGVAVRLFREALFEERLPFTIADIRQELRGRDLGCWCGPGQACHVDVLLEVANRA